MAKNKNMVILIVCLLGILTTNNLHSECSINEVYLSLNTLHNTEQQTYGAFTLKGKN